MQLDGWTWEDMTLKSRAGMHIQWPRMTPVSRWNEAKSAAQQVTERDKRLADLAEFFDKAKRYHETNDDEVDLRYDAMEPILDGKMPIIVHADTRLQIQSAVGFAAERKLQLIIFGGYDAASCASLLNANGVSVIVPEGVPFAPATFRALRPRLHSACQTSPGRREILYCRRRSVWCVQSQELALPRCDRGCVWTPTG